MKLKNLKTNYLGQDTIYFESIDSTQLEILRMIQSGNIQNGTLIIANIQTNAMRNTWTYMAYRRAKQYSIFILYKIRLRVK